ncbi:hypothetical protein AMS68_005132 [Peltaster fructicola]|uniref:Pleckstrin homology domain-containing protein n=1 Tax=Peltaster fructicola TaxID=286661 RepID=A0A6H0XY82_9PEZI|nr:hypothetical protein AMS68_005132 [Peltaster fructicola]
MPPYPIPTRSSSRQVPFSHSEGSWSPTVDPFGPRATQTSRSHMARQQSLRKVQSTTSIRHAKTKSSPRKGRRRLRSPELTPVQSMAFESPAPTAFPIPELPTPLQHGPGSDYQWGSRSTRLAGTSISSMPFGDETGLVDSIAATMVGEWMWKYIRKRKSFGVGESTEDFAQAAESGVLDMQGIGTRHKRWVWLSPYEKTIMWDSKQPTSGTALLGKKGRKLVIQSVIDVKDDTPLPKKPELESAHGRSILILTPARALKFTTVTAERHHYWMTALSFLAESNRMENELPPLPLVPPVPQRAPPPPPISQKRQVSSPTFGLASVRDSVRVAKGKQPEDPLSTNDAYPRPLNPIPTFEDNGADFPAVPRLYSSTSKHQRKRSNTSPRLPPALNTLRSFSSTAGAGPSSSRPSGSAGKGNIVPGSSYSGSRGNSVASPDRPNFFEATGTVRMEAFVDPNVKNGVLYVPAPPGAAPAQPSRRGRGDSSLSATTVDKRRAGYVFDEDGMDPFKGF